AVRPPATRSGPIFSNPCVISSWYSISRVTNPKRESKKASELSRDAVQAGCHARSVANLLGGGKLASPIRDGPPVDPCARIHTIVAGKHGQGRSLKTCPRPGVHRS